MTSTLNGHGVRIPNPTVSGDAAAQLLADLHERAELSGYSRVRIDRGMHDCGAWYEVGYVYGEIKVRMSHRPDFKVVRIEPDTGEQFEVELYQNTLKGQQLTSSKKKGKGQK